MDASNATPIQAARAVAGFFVVGGALTLLWVGQALLSSDPSTGWLWIGACALLMLLAGLTASRYVSRLRARRGAGHETAATKPAWLPAVLSVVAALGILASQVISGTGQLGTVLLGVLVLVVSGFLVGLMFALHGRRLLSGSG